MMFAEERRAKIFELLQADGRVLVKELADKFQVSVDSIRKDLSLMEEQGLLKKTHGGAVKIPKVRPEPLHPSIRYTEGNSIENAISQLAVSYLHEKDTIFIGSAGINYGMVKYLPKHIPITIVTNSLRIADTLRELEYIDTYLVGGRVKQSGNISDTLAIEFLRQFTFDLCFLSGSGISINGLSTSTPEVASLNRTACERSRKRICLSPHYKIGYDSFSKSVPINQLDLIITDNETDQDFIEQFESKGVKVVVVDPDINPV